MTAIQKSVPALRFKDSQKKDYPDWEEVNLDNLGKTFCGLTGKKKEHFGRGRHYIQYLQVFEDSKINLDGFGLVEVRNNESQNAVQYGDVFFTTSSETPTEVGIASVLLDDVEDTYLNSFCFGYRINQDRLFPEFARYTFRQNYFRKEVIRLAQGSTRYNLSKTSLMKIKTKLPIKQEQQKIATFLSSVDSKIEQLTKKKALLEQYKKGMVQKLFSQEIRFKNRQGEEYPDWEEADLDNLGKTFSGLTGKNKEHFGRGKRYIQYLQVFEDSKINLGGFGLVEIRNNESQNAVQYGDVFFTTSSETPTEVGITSVLLDDVKDTYLNSFCFGYRINQERLLPEYARYAFRQNYFRKEVVRLAQGSTRYNLSKTSLMKIKTKLPVKQEQKKIADFLSAIDGKIKLTTEQIRQAQTFKKGLLQQMFI